MDIIKGMSIKDLKTMHKGSREKIECAKPDASPENKWMRALNPKFNPIKSEGLIVLSEVEKELNRRGYNAEKLFKGYNKKAFRELHF